MNKTILFCLTAAYLLLCGCTATDVPYPDTAENLDVMNMYVSPTEARSRHAVILSSQNTRSAGVTIGDCTPLDKKGNPITRADDETWYYVFHTSGEKPGFAIMGARRDIPELLAMGDGNPNFRDSEAMIPDPSCWKSETSIL